jgi:hypothetical protein
VEAAALTIRGLRRPAAVWRVVVFAEQARAAMVATRNHMEGRNIGLIAAGVFKTAVLWAD